MYSPNLRQAARAGCRAGLFVVSRCGAATSAGFPREDRDQPGAVGNDRRRSSIVSGLFFTMNAATLPCEAQRRGRLAANAHRAFGEGGALLGDSAHGVRGRAGVAASGALHELEDLL